MFKTILEVIWSALQRWSKHDGAGLAAAVSFYALFSMAPMLVFSVLVTSQTIGPERAKDAAVEWLSDMVPGDSAESLVSMVHMRVFADGAWWSNVISGAVLIWASSSIFVRLQVGTLEIFDQDAIRPRPQWLKTLVGRLIGIAYAIVVGLIICVIFVIPGMVAPLISELHYGFTSIASLINALLLSIGGYIILRVVPSPAPRKRALVAASLFFMIYFLIGRLLFQIYISHSPLASAYGVASSVVIFLVWIYYMSCGYFIGAALCAEMARRNPRDSVRSLVNLSL
ncbi:MAG: YihY/virulence factor BrkB family protein [Verrucomicrobiota bacterium]